VRGLTDSDSVQGVTAAGQDQAPPTRQLREPVTGTTVADRVRRTVARRGAPEPPPVPSGGATHSPTWAGSRPAPDIPMEPYDQFVASDAHARNLARAFADASTALSAAAKVNVPDAGSIFDDHR